MDAATSQYLRLASQASEAWERHTAPPRERTEAEEDLIAMEDLILMTQGPDALRAHQLRREHAGEPDTDGLGLLSEDYPTHPGYHARVMGGVR